MLLLSLTLVLISSISASFPMPFGYPSQHGPPPMPPMFKPISRSGPPSIQRREPAPLVFPGSLTRGKMRDQFRAATAGLPMRTLMLQLKGSPSRGMAHYVNAPPAFKYLKPSPLPSPSPTIIVKPLKHEALKFTPSTHNSLIKARPTSEYAFEKPHVSFEFMFFFSIFKFLNFEY